MSHQVKRIDKKLLPALHFHKKREFWIRKMSTHPLYYILLYIDIVVLHQNFTFFGVQKKSESSDTPVQYGTCWSTFITF